MTHSFHPVDCVTHGNLHNEFPIEWLGVVLEPTQSHQINDFVGSWSHRLELYK